MLDELLKVCISTSAAICLLARSNITPPFRWVIIDSTFDFQNKHQISDGLESE